MGYDDDVGRKRKAFTLVDDAAIEDDDVDEDDEDEIEEPPRSRHNRNVARYIDDEVEVQDDDTEEEEESEIYGEDIPDIAETDDKPSLHRRYAAAHDIAGEEDVDLLEAYINERYRTVEVAVDATTANEQSLVPNQMDPKLWIVQCRPGYERSLCLQLLNKFVHCRGKGMPLLIKSAISLDHLKGYLYVEAEKESHVAAAVSGMRYVQHTKKIKLVPLKEMVAAITPNRVAKLPIEIGSWVRVRNGPYAQDLAKVIHVDHAHRKIDLKVVPRIDFVDLLHRQEGRYINRSRDPFGKKAKVRPRATRFCPDECRALGLVVERRKGMDGETLLAVGNYIFHDGYLIKTMSMRSILVEDAASFEEIQAFESASSKGTMKDDTQTGLQDAAAAAGKKFGLFKGDCIRVIYGEMVGMTGVVKDLLPNDRILVQMDNEDVKDLVEIEVSYVVKHFELGDHVSVREGIFRGKKGIVIKTEANKCRILSDLDSVEFWAVAKDISKTQDSASGIDAFGAYGVEDLVKLHEQRIGVIIFADHAFCTVLVAGGDPMKPELVKVTQQDILGKCETGRIGTTDKFNNRVMMGDIVDFVIGFDKRMSGTVKYVIQNYVFAKTKERNEHLGYICIHSKHCIVRGGHRNNSFSFPRGSVDGSRRGRTGRGRGRFLKGRNARNPFQDRVMVTITRGAHRGYRGRVKDETATHVRVELDAGSRIITLPKDDVEILDAERNWMAPAGGSWNVSGGLNDTVAYAAPKTPYGEHHPPGTPFLSNRDIMTSPKYTPVPELTPKAFEEAPMESDSDSEMRFGDEEAALSTTAAPKKDVKMLVPDVVEPPSVTLSSSEDAGMDLGSVSKAQVNDLVVCLSDGTFGIVKDVNEDLSQVEICRLQSDGEGRSFQPTGELRRVLISELKCIVPQKGDWLRVLEGVSMNSVGQMIAADGNDCIVRLQDVQIFSKQTVAVTLPPSSV